MNTKYYADMFTIVKEKDDYALKKYVGPDGGIVCIPEGVTRISSGSFTHYKNIQKLILPHTLKRIPDNMCAFWEKLEEIVIPEGITSIGNGAFKGTSLKEITLPSTLERLGTSAFDFCEHLKKVVTNHISSSLLASFFYSDYETMESKCNREPHDRELKFKLYLGSNEDMELSRFFKYYNPMLEGKAKFEIKELFVLYNNFVIGYIGTDTTLQIPDSVIGIGYEAFMGNHKIQSVTMGKKVTQIGYSAFEGCSSLHHVTLNKNLESVGDEAFRYTKIKVITLPLKVQYVGAYAFSNCPNIQEVIIEDNNYGNYKLQRWDRLWNIGISDKLKFNIIW